MAELSTKVPPQSAQRDLIQLITSRAPSGHRRYRTLRDLHVRQSDSAQWCLLKIK